MEIHHFLKFFTCSLLSKQIAAFRHEFLLNSLCSIRIALNLSIVDLVEYFADKRSFTKFLFNIFSVSLVN